MEKAMEKFAAVTGHLSAATEELGLSLFWIADSWILIQRRNFDMFLEDEPYHAVQMYVDALAGRFIVRAWGRTKLKGYFGGDLDMLEQLCWATFHDQVACVGVILRDPPGQDNFVTNSPVWRQVATGCQATYKLSEDPSNTEQQGIGLCGECITNCDKIVVKAEIHERDEEDVFKQHAGVPDYDDDHAADEGEEKPKPKRKAKAENPERNLTCKYCKMEFKSSRQLMYHRWKAHAYEMYACHLCNFRKRGPPSILTDHLAAKHRDKEEPAKCPFCAESVPRSEFDSHCSKCCVSYRKKKASKAGQVLVPCDFCGKQISKNHLSMHRKMHTDDALQCERCHFKCAFPSQLRIHVDRAHGEGPKPEKEVHQCEQCGAQLCSKNSLNYHVRVKHDKKLVQFPCPHCDQSFPNASTRRRHVNSIHFPDRYRCPVCLRTMGSKGQLDKHMLSHAEGQFVCGECGKALKSQESLTAHFRIHSGESPFGCNYCNFHGKSAVVLHNHKKMSHRIEYKIEREAKGREIAQD